jgi:DNA repair protein RadA/Sms
MAKTATTARWKERPAYRCGECGFEVPKWVGRCPECQAWGAVDEVGRPTLRSVAPGPVSAPAARIADVDAEAARMRPTGFGELDRVLGGGLVPGGVILLAGEPGVGKSTLLLAVAARVAGSGGKALIVTGEESPAQVRLRAGRIGALADHLYLCAESDLGAVLGHLDEVRPDLVVVDSVQTISAADVDASAGGVTQVRHVAASLSRAAKERGVAAVLVGHVTKDGAVAGPRSLEHLVDVVCSFEGDRHSRLRLVRGVKNRFGPADEVGCFEVTDEGIDSVTDPSGLFVSPTSEPVAGTCLTVAVEGRRPLVAEVQALVGAESPSTPRRATSGLDASRVAMVLAVVERRAGVRLHSRELYAATVGGVRLAEPAADLALALAVVSSAADASLPAGLVAIGEVGLAGEVRRVTGIGHRLAEAARLGFDRALVPAGSNVRAPGTMLVTEVADVRGGVDAVAAAARLAAAPPE